MNKKKHFDVNILCRLNGAKPTVRDRWVAFYRLWRTGHKNDLWHDSNTVDCFRILFGRSVWIGLMHTDDGVALGGCRKDYPLFLRRRLLDGEKRRRLHGNHPEWAERDKLVANKLRGQGMEVLPTEVAEVRRKAIDKIRSVAASKSIPVPEDDDVLLKQLSRAMKEEGGGS